MTDPNPTTTPTPPQGLTDEQLLTLAAGKIEHYDRIEPGEYEAENKCAIEIYGSELIAVMRAAIAAHEATRTEVNPLSDLAKTLITSQQLMDPEVAAALAPETRWEMYDDEPVHTLHNEREELARTLESQAQFSRRAAALLRSANTASNRLHRLQQENHRFREPERTILCDLLANGDLLPDPDGKRYGLPTVVTEEAE